MDLLLTSSDASSQFREFERVTSCFAVLHLDRPYDLQVSRDRAVVWQEANRVLCDKESRCVFLPFRAPHELGRDAGEALEATESLEILEEAIELSGAAIHNPPARWRRAYLKTALLKISRSFPALVPDLDLVNGVHAEGIACEVDRIAKSGFGVRRPINGLYPRASRIPAGQPFRASRRYRYVVQDRVLADKELRAYVTRSLNGYQVSGFEMPVGSAESPDWRDSTRIEDLRVVPTKDSRLLELSSQLAAELQLEYACFDFLESRAGLHLIDINPHGSWTWLPDEACRIVDSQVVSWLVSLSSGAAR